MKKRLLAVLLTVCMVVMLLPTAAFADDETSPVEVATAEALLKEITELPKDGTTVTIKLTASITVDSRLEIPSTANVVLDLGRNTLTVGKEARQLAAAVTDSKGEITSIYGLFVNRGTLTIQNGTITDKEADASTNGALLVNTSTGILTLDNTVTLNGLGRTALTNVMGTTVSEANMNGHANDQSTYVTNLVEAFGGTLKLMGGTLTNENWYKDKNNVTYGSEGVIVYNGAYDSQVAGRATTVYISGCTISTNIYAVSTNNVLSDGSSVTIKNSALTAARVGIYWPSAGTLTIGENASDTTTINATTPIEICCGTLVINGGTFNASYTGTAKFTSASLGTVYRKNSGSCSPADAVSIIANRAKTAGGGYDDTKLSVTINGGTFNANYACSYAVRYLDCNYRGTGSTTSYVGGLKGASIQIKGGNFKGGAGDIDLSTATGGVEKGAITGGKFANDDVTPYCAEGLAAVTNPDPDAATYGYKVDEMSADAVEDVEAAMSVGKTQADASFIQDPETKAAVKEALEKVAADEESLTGAVKAVDVTDAQKEAAIKALAAAGIIKNLENGQVPDGTTVTIVKQAYLDVAVEKYETSEDDATENTITVDITPKYNLIATTDETGNVTDKNSVTIAEAQTLTVEGPVDVTIPLPADFVDGATTAYIVHTHDGKDYVYTGEIAENELSFTSVNGFSKFKVALKNPSVATVTSTSGSEVGYFTLQDAVNAAKDGDIITLTGDNTEEVTVSHPVTFIVKGGTAKIAAGTGYSRAVRNEDGGKQYSFWVTPTYVASTSYAITVSDSEGGKVTASAAKAAKGTKVVLTPKAEDGKELDTLTVTDATGKKLDVTKGTDGTYSFTMPAGAVTVKATFKAAAEANCPSKAFTDVDTSKWYHEYVDYALNNGIMEGNGDGTFTPNKELNRAQLAQILYNLAGKPAVTGKSTFTDVADGAWYSDAVIWAAQQGIVDGYEDGTFHPTTDISRQDLAVMLWRYAGKPAATQTTLSFTDADQVSGYAKAAVLWANEKGIMEGNDNGTLTPKGNATRAQAAKMVAVYLQSK